jgi:hypothetical protein
LGADGKRVELIDEGQSSNATSYIGLGLIASLIVGSGPLLDALNGNGPFESAMLRYLACLGVCVVAAATLGRMLDNAQYEDDDPGGPNGPNSAESDGDGGTAFVSDDPADGERP